MTQGGFEQGGAREGSCPRPLLLPGWLPTSVCNKHPTHPASLALALLKPPNELRMIIKTQVSANTKKENDSWGHGGWGGGEWARRVLRR